MRPIWKGTITFGLVNIPVQLMSAVRRSERISFRQLHREDLAPIKYERVCQADGERVPWSDIVKGYEYEKGRYVVLTPEDFAAVALESTKTIDLLDFVAADDVDPRFFETPYYLLPNGREARKAYALLREAVREAGVIGIGKLTLRSNSHHLVGIKVIGDALLLEIMRFADELVDGDEFAFPTADDVRPQELQMARQLVASLQEPFDPTKYRDEYRDRLMEVIRAKLAGEEIHVVEPAEPEATGVVDLMARLRESLAQAKRPGAKPAAAPAKARASRARKTAASRGRKSA